MYILALIEAEYFSFEPKDVYSVNWYLQFIEIMGLKDYKTFNLISITVKTVSSKLFLFFSPLICIILAFFQKKDYKTFNLKWIPSTFVVKPVSSKLSLFFHFWDGKRTSKVKRMNQPSMWIHTLNQTYQNESKLANFVGTICIER